LKASVHCIQGRSLDHHLGTQNLVVTTNAAEPVHHAAPGLPKLRSRILVEGYMRASKGSPG
ncbi:hypothetical protein FA13DRAFT_1736622, partial [Coprinellus micaceus]